MCRNRLEILYISNTCKYISNYFASEILTLGEKRLKKNNYREYNKKIVNVCKALNIGSPRTLKPMRVKATPRDHYFSNAKSWLSFSFKVSLFIPKNRDLHLVKFLELRA